MNDEVPIGSSAMQCPLEQLRITCKVHRKDLDESPRLQKSIHMHQPYELECAV